MAPQRSPGARDRIFNVTITSERYAPAVLGDVRIGPDAAPLSVELRPGCLVEGVETPAGSLPSRAVLEVLDPDLELPFIFITRRPGRWNLGVLEEGKPFVLAITEGGATIARQEFVATPREAVRLAVPGKEN